MCESVCVCTCVSPVGVCLYACVLLGVCFCLNTERHRQMTHSPKRQRQSRCSCELSRLQGLLPGPGFLVNAENLGIGILSHPLFRFTQSLCPRGRPVGRARGCFQSQGALTSPVLSPASQTRKQARERKTFARLWLVTQGPVWAPDPCEVPSGAWTGPSSVSAGLAGSLRL